MNLKTNNTSLWNYNISTLVAIFVELIVIEELWI